MNPTIINHERFGEIRAVKIKNEPWFVAKDVCDSLGYSKDVSSVLSKLDEDEKGTENFRTLGGSQSLAVVNESGLYNLIFRSNKPEAKHFRKWVTAEVLPAIRKYGTYTSDAKVTERLEAKYQKKVQAVLCQQIRSKLAESDIKMLAKTCGVADWHVRDVLSGYKQDVYLLNLAYARATGNKLLQQAFYTADGALTLTRALLG
jgi:prophage antirepressor-like protein